MTIDSAIPARASSRDQFEDQLLDPSLVSTSHASRDHGVHLCFDPTDSSSTKAEVRREDALGLLSVDRRSTQPSLGLHLRQPKDCHWWHWPRDLTAFSAIGFPCSPSPRARTAADQKSAGQSEDVFDSIDEVLRAVVDAAQPAAETGRSDLQAASKLSLREAPPRKLSSEHRIVEASTGQLFSNRRPPLVPAYDFHGPTVGRTCDENQVGRIRRCGAWIYRVASRSEDLPTPTIGHAS